MSDWSGLIFLHSNFVNYFVGDLGLFFITVLVVVVGLLLSVRVSPLFSFVIPSPLLFVMARNGYLSSSWPSAVILLVLSLVWALVLWRLME